MYHIHAWELNEGRNALEAHIVIVEGLALREVEGLKAEIKTLLEERFHIAHSTLEFGLQRTESEKCL